MLTRVVIVWFGLFATAFFNAALRELLFKKGLGIIDPLANQLSCFTGICLLTLFTWSVWKKMQITSIKKALFVGILWFIMTLLTETFILNRLISKLTWEQILQTYNILEGHFWPFVLIWIGFLPIFFFYIKNRTRESSL